MKSIQISKRFRLAHREKPSITSASLPSVLVNRLLIFIILVTLAIAPGSSPGQEKVAFDERQFRQDLKSGWVAYSNGDYREAVRIFESVLANSPENPEALFALGSVWAYRRPGENVVLARQYFSKMSNGNVSEEDRVFQAWSLNALAGLDARPPITESPEVSQADRKKAIESYEKVIVDYSPSLPAEEALILQQDLRLGLEPPENDLVIATLTEFLTKNPKSPYLSHAYTVLAQAYENKKDSDNQVACMISALETKEIDPNNIASIRAGTYWGIASVAQFKAGNFEIARKYYNKLIQDFPRDQLVFSTKLALKSMDEMEAKIRSESEVKPQ